MTHHIESLKKNVIINAKDIEKIRISIAKKMPNTNEKERAKILARAIIRVIDTQINWIEEEHKLRIRRELLNYLIKEGKNELIQYDVYTVCLNYSANFYEIRSQLEVWAYENSKIENQGILHKIGLWFDRYQLHIIKGFLATATFILIALITNNLLSGKSATKAAIEVDSSKFIVNKYEYYSEVLGIPTSKLKYAYKEYEYGLIKDYLKSRNSMLLEDSRFEKLVEIAELKDIDPLILLAIIGQEQGFVPKDAKYATQIINNPFNVYHSWMDYNTTFSKSAIIASNTVNNLLAKMEQEEDVFYWLNTAYAEDDAWAQGVRKLYNILYSLT